MHYEVGGLELDDAVLDADARYSALIADDYIVYLREGRRPVR